LLIALDGFSRTGLGRKPHKRRHGYAFDGSGLGKELLIGSAEFEIQALIDGRKLTKDFVGC